MSKDRLLQRLDQQRRQAMIAADAVALDHLLADDLVWTHSSGLSETKGEFIAAIVKRDVEYQVLEVMQDQVRCVGSVGLHQGMFRGAALRDGQEKQLLAKFIAVWREVELVATGDLSMQLIAWQSTNCRA